MDNFRDSYFEVRWDLTTNPLKGTYGGKQYDTGRGFVVTVINGGQVVTPTNEVLRLKWEKPDSTTGYVNATIVDGKFIIENIDQMFTVQGSVRADFELYVGGKFVASSTFYVSVAKAVAVDSIESSSEFTALHSALLDVGTVQDSLDGYVDAESVRAANESIRIDNESDREAAEGLRVSAETDREAAETLRQTGYATMDEAIALKADLSEIESARGTEPTLGARLDSTDAQLNNVTQDFTQHKLDYASQRQQDQLKVAKVERDINDYQSTMASVNVNQEAKQSVTGYGTISLPKNTANGQVGISLKGNTITDETGTKSTVSASRLKSVGKNLFDGVLKSGIINGITGVDAADPSWVRSKNYIEVSPNATYTFSSSKSNRNVRCYDSSKTFIVSFNKAAGPNVFTTPPNCVYIRITNTSTDLNEPMQVELGDVSAYEPYTESTQYLPNVGELRSLPNGVKDEVRVSGEKAELVKRVSDTMKKLAKPIVTPIQVSGNLISYPSGTVYVENVVADAGIYTDKLTVLHSDLPIKEVEKVSKVDFTTGVETELDVSQCVIAEDKLSFTHPNLSDEDIVFFTYYYDLESTLGETTIEYYDSRHTLKDDVTGKFYKIVPKISDGALTNELVEV